MDKNKIYQSLFSAYVEAYFPKKSKKDCQDEIIKKWNEIKNDADFKNKSDALMKELKSISLKKKASNLLFWSNQTSNKERQLAKNSSEIQNECDQDLMSANEAANDAVEHVNTSSMATSSSRVYIARAQIELQSELDVVNSDLVGLYEREKKGQLSDEQLKDLKAKALKKIELEKKLKLRKNEQERAKKARDAKKVKLDSICTDHPELRAVLKHREKTGRPRVEDDQPMLLKSIIDIAMYGSASHEKRNSDIYRTIKTLDELTEQLNKDGFSIKRSGVYLRLMPRRSNSLEGRRHVNTVPVRLIRAQNDQHAKHIDGFFCTATIRQLEEIASLLGPKEVCFISQDDKCRVPIGLTAASSQSPLLMHVQYRVQLPDHDWVVAERHKLIPSVYAGIQIQPNGFGKRDAVGYSGPTYIAIRSGKHSSSTAFSHALDFDRILDLKEFDVITRSGLDRQVKPVVIFTVDGGPDENPRYQKVIKVAIHHFSENDLDAIFIATNAPGRSAFNRVERKMAPLSKELSGLILPHDHYGSHLDNNGKTIDNELEKKNFEFAGKTLAEIWSELVVDNFPTLAEYIQPDASELPEGVITTKDQIWFDNHVRTSQYFTQIVKCNNRKCCSSPRSSYLKVVPCRFLPPPLPLIQGEYGLEIADRNSDSSTHNFSSLFVNLSLKIEEMLPRSAMVFKVMPYDLFCPSVQSSLLDRVCKTCSIYFASLVILRQHISAQHKQVTPSVKKVRPVRVAARRQRELMVVIAREENGESMDWMHEDDLNMDGVIVPDQDNVHDVTPVIPLSQHFKSIWENK